MKELQLIWSSIGGLIGWYLGGIDGFIYALVAFVVMDYVTGFMAAMLEKKLSSEVGFRGIFKKVLIFILVGIAHVMDFYLIGNGSAIRTAVIFFYVANEGISILENVGQIGLPIPKKLRDILVQLKEKEDHV